ncbi:MAG: hypothetical protein JOZ87_23480 [Chloroflexi bacterium]|nr:hypothetical protein [Chloroflexota bacterium]
MRLILASLAEACDRGHVVILHGDQELADRYQRWCDAHGRHVVLLRHVESGWVVEVRPCAGRGFGPCLRARTADGLRAAGGRLELSPTGVRLEFSCWEPAHRLAQQLGALAVQDQVRRSRARV